MTNKAAEEKQRKVLPIDKMLHLPNAATMSPSCTGVDSTKGETHCACTYTRTRNLNYLFLQDIFILDTSADALAALYRFASSLKA